MMAIDAQRSPGSSYPELGTEEFGEFVRERTVQKQMADVLDEMEMRIESDQVLSEGFPNSLQSFT